MATEIYRTALIRYFLKRSLKFWKSNDKGQAYFLGLGFVFSLFANLGMALFINTWSKGFFDALQAHNLNHIMESIKLLAILAVGTAIAAIITVQFRMRLQLKWRLWLMSNLVDRWVASSMSRDKLMTYLIDNPEARIADDGRIAIELLVEMGGGIIYTLLISSSFIIVLWNIGGHVFVFGYSIHGYLVYSVLIYTGLTSIGMLLLCVPLVKTVEEKAAAEGNFRYYLTENIHQFVESSNIETVRSPELQSFFELLLLKWINVIRGQTKIISFATTNNLIAPIIPVVLCAPKYLSGEMTLGDIMQTAAAFLQVQSSLNWLADNAFSIANWSASARRVAALDDIILNHDHY